MTRSSSDCSEKRECSESERREESCSGNERHDEWDDHKYKKRCHCQRCVGTYDDWCRKHKEKGCTTCKRKCYTICEIVCEKPVTHVYHWGYKKEYEGRWEPYHGAHGPRQGEEHHEEHHECGRCHKRRDECECRRERRVHREHREHREHHNCNRCHKRRDECECRGERLVY